MSKSQPGQSYYLSLDQGGHSSRAIVFNGDGDMVLETKQSVHVERPKPEWVEQDAELLAASVETVLRQALDQCRQQSIKITSIGLATQRSNVVCWHKVTGKALSPAISWQDRRMHRWLNKFQHRNEEIHKKTGLFITAHYGASKLRWCLDNIAAVQKAFREDNLCWGPLASFLVFRLTQEHNHLVDPANASRTLVWDLKTQDWDKELLALFGLPLSPFPKCMKSIDDYGSISIDTGSIPLRVVAGDQPAALLAFGEPLTDTAYINIGTGAFIQRPTAKIIHYAKRLLSGVVMSTQEESFYDLECTVNGAGSALTHVENQLGIDNDYAEQQFSGWLQKAEHPPLFLNGVAGLGSPFWIPDFQSQFVETNGVENEKIEKESKQSISEDWEKIVAVAESIVFLIQHNLQELMDVSGNIDRIVLSGGLSVSDGLCQRLATLSQIPVFRLRACEATARGTAFLLANFAKHWGENIEGDWFYALVDHDLQTRYKQWSIHMQSHVNQKQSQKQQQRFVAHRGDRHNYPENTLSAFKSAIDCGASFVEFDVQFSKDQVPIVIHDRMLARLTGEDKDLFQLNANAALSLSAHEPERFQDKFVNEKILSLSEMVSLLQSSSDTIAFVEIKRATISEFGIEPVLNQLIKVLEPVMSQSVLISFNHQILQHHNADKFAGIGWVFDEWNDSVMSIANELKPDYLFVDIDCIPASPYKLQSGPWQWVVYEVSEMQIAKNLFDRGVSLIETDNICAMTKQCTVQSGND